MHFYLDESGDLGWNFCKPYRSGGSSRYMTIGVLQVPPTKLKFPKRLIKGLYSKYQWNTKKEKKWSGMREHERLEFAERAFDLAVRHPDIQYLAITVSKEKVFSHIRSDSNKLYNYMIRTLLVDEMARHPEVIFRPDPRSIKVASGNSLHDYLQTTLWFDKKVSTTLMTEEVDSASCICTQFSDMLSGAVQHHFEDQKSKPFYTLNNKLRTEKLYFT